MDEPPIVEQSAAQPSGPVNPFEATVTPSLPSEKGGVNLPAVFWIVVIGAGIVLGAMCPYLPGIGVPGLAALVPAVIRVPLVQRRLSISRPERILPSPVVMLFASWVFTLIMGFAALISFFAICLPAGIFMFAGGEEELIWVYAVFTISGLIGFAVFLFLFFVSLRLPI